MKLNVNVQYILSFVVSRMLYGFLPHKYDVINGIFPKYLQNNKKKINNTFQHKFSILHGSIVDSLLSVNKPFDAKERYNSYAYVVFSLSTFKMETPWKKKCQVRN